MSTKTDFLDVCRLAEMLHRQFLSAINTSLESLGVGDINSTRAMILVNLGDMRLTSMELVWTGAYAGSNVSYNLRKLVAAGYVTQTRSADDGRLLLVEATAKGADLRAVILASVAAQTESTGGDDLVRCVKTLRNLHTALVNGAPHRATEKAA